MAYGDNNSPVTASWSFDYAAVVICYDGGIRKDVAYLQVKVPRQEQMEEALLAETFKEGHRVQRIFHEGCEAKDGRRGSLLIVVDNPGRDFWECKEAAKSDDKAA